MLTSDLACKTSQVHILHKEKIEYFTLKLIIRGPDFLLRQSLDRLPARVLLLLSLEEVVVEVVARVLLSLVTPAPA